MIEAVFEDPALKHKVFGEIQHVVNADALLGSDLGGAYLRRLLHLDTDRKVMASS